MINQKATAVGLTAAFGSGSTTGAKQIRDKRGFCMITLSDELRAEWQARHVDVSPSRRDLQRLGDELRGTEGPGTLVRRALERLEHKDDVIDRIAIDGIRNLGEVSSLREQFHDRFTLFAVLCDIEARWERVSAEYLEAGRSRLDFAKDDQRDQNEETPTGQQVQLCIDRADVVLDNAGYVTLGEFHEKTLHYVDLVVGEEQRPPNPDEVRMHVAYSSSYGTRCLKRHVGAVLVDVRGQIISGGYNENPSPTAPCVEEPRYGGRCYRDIVRNTRFKQLANQGVTCPVCKAALPLIEGPPWYCPTCEQHEDRDRTNLEEFFFPDRAMNWCTAVHAEVAAILAAEGRARGATLYTTTFPCMQCAEKITQAEIRKVIYTEAYVDTAGLERLDIAEIEVEQFEGVRSGAFDRVFSHTKPE